MTFTYLLNDLRKNRGVNASLLVVLILSAFLMATGAMVMERTVGSVDALFAQAKPPHFLQMHKGDYDPAALDAFATAHPEIESWLIEDMVGYDSAAIAWSRPGTTESGTLAESLIDNLFVTQNTEFDFLLDADSAIVTPPDGSIFVPVAYQRSFGLQEGDELRIRTGSGIEEFAIAGFVRDAQMASSLSSATRFLVSDSDFQRLRSSGGSPEIIVEYLLSDPSQANAFQTAYESDPAMPKNGQAVTGDMIRIINAISDGLVAIALMFVSFLLIAIALLNVRFVIRGSLQDDVQQIGAMKAIGLPDKTISGLYLSKYSAMTLIACVLGGALAIPASQALTSGMRASYSTAPVTALTVVAPLVALVVVFVVVVAISRHLLRAVNRIEVVSALVHGSVLDERQTARRAKRLARRVSRSAFASYRGGDIGRRMSLADLRNEAGQWVLLPLVFLLAGILITLPTNLLTTFQSPKFVTYMGAPESDLRMDLQFSDDLEQVREETDTALAADPRVARVQTFANELVETEGEEGWESMRVEVGDYGGDTIQYLRGGPPATGEIALSVLNAEQFGVDVGDPFTIRRDGSDAALTVGGVYQDITSGGKTAKMSGTATGAVTGYVYYAATATGQDPAAIASDYRERFPTATVVPMAEYVTQTLSYVTDALFNAAVLATIFAVGIVALITSLNLTMRVSRERRRSGILSALGFSGSDLAAQLRFKAVLTIVTGTVLGVVIAATLGQALVGAAISLAGLGISSLVFIPNPLLVYVAYPALLIGVGAVSAIVVSSRLRRGDTSAWLRS
ncbi:putative ABC transport system permease protein [Clavibacter michiganensis]|uniref:ABC transporter permease n=1 Tax=Clavibacter michiganensis TaxID=28447 RepID=UPI0019585717|nr:FtsX-like permease family protein [Clavibacter michiganensis]MBM7411142.1 putative ABC transport system permease protein [Clavibacter michiganensis]